MEGNKFLTQILSELDRLYAWDDKCFLFYRKPWELLFATILSAQCTDDRVNKITPRLFSKYKSLSDFAEANVNELEEIIKPTGFYHAKAKHIKESAYFLLHELGGQMPNDINILTKMPGVGRKTANIIRGHIFFIASIVVDTHVKRISYRLGLTKNTNPEKIEYDLMETLPESHWIRFNRQIILHGRLICKARNPKCNVCTLKEWCLISAVQPDNLA